MQTTQECMVDLWETALYSW